MTDFMWLYFSTSLWAHLTGSFLKHWVKEGHDTYSFSRNLYESHVSECFETRALAVTGVPPGSPRALTRQSQRRPVGPGAPSCGLAKPSTDFPAPGDLQQQQLPAAGIPLRVRPVLSLCVRFWATLGSGCRLCTARTFFPMSGTKGTWFEVPTVWLPLPKWWTSALCQGRGRRESFACLSMRSPQLRKYFVHT